MDLKPFFVEFRLGAVVMAANQADALMRGESFALDIVRDSQFLGQSAIPARSIEQLQQLDPELTGSSIPYGGEPKVTLAEMLPYESRDPKTVDMFPQSGAGAGPVAIGGCK